MSGKKGGENDEKKLPEYTDILGLRIFGIDIGELFKNWLGVRDLSILQDPSKVEALKKRIEEQRGRLKDTQEELRRKFGDAVRFDYDIRVGTLKGGKDEIRIGGGRFFEVLDELARQGSQRREQAKPVHYKERKGVLEPSTEVIDAENYLEVIADLPGIEEKDIELKVQQDKVVLSATSAERTYKTEIPLPTKVLEEPLEKSYYNGVFKVRLKKSV